MSDTESFISEVSEEVRKDQLFGYIKRYGWIAVLLVLLLVGGAAYNEWSKAQARSAAQATGDQLIAALNEEDPAAQTALLLAMDSKPGEAPVVNLLTAAAQLNAEDAAAASSAFSCAAAVSLSLIHI